LTFWYYMVIIFFVGRNIEFQFLEKWLGNIWMGGK